MVHLEEIIKAHRTLQKLEPKNELLTYMRVEGDYAIAWPKEAYREFIEKYVRKSIYDKVGNVNDVYLSELNKAIEAAKEKSSRPVPSPQNLSQQYRQKPRQQKLFGSP